MHKCEKWRVTVAVKSYGHEASVSPPDQKAIKETVKHDIKMLLTIYLPVAALKKKYYIFLLAFNSVVTKTKMHSPINTTFVAVRLVD